MTLKAYALLAVAVVALAFTACKEKSKALQGCQCDVTDTQTQAVESQFVDLNTMKANEVNDCRALVNKAQAIWGEGVEVSCTAK